jgi:two-component system OmpR family sensor kinase
LSRRLERDLDSVLTHEAEAFAGALEATAADHVPPDDIVDLVSAARGYLSARTGAGPDAAAILLVRFKNGTLLSNSTIRLENAPGNRLEVSSTVTRPEFSGVELGEETYRVATVPVLDAGNQPVAVFQAAVPSSPTKELTNSLLWTLATGGALVILIGAALSSSVARTSLRPLHRAAATARGISLKSLSRRVPYEGPADDVGHMVDALNGMLDGLEKAFAEQRRFIADVSHEIRTPLTVIRGHVEVTRDQAKLTRADEESLDLVLDELDRLSRMVEDLLALARLEAGAKPRLETVNLAEIAREAATRARVLGPRRLAVDGVAELPVHGSRDLLLQAVLNLLGNAVNHTAIEGSIAVMCSRVADVALVTIEDDGTGIPESDLPHIFDRFYRSPRERSREDGSGLGLAITQRLIEVHGGTIKAANGSRGGAIFTVELPIAEGRPQPAPARRRRRFLPVPASLSGRRLPSMRRF